MENNLRTLGKAESKVVLSLREEGRSLVQTADILGILGTDVPETTARKVIRNLVRKGWLSRIVGGKYMLLPPEHGPQNLGENNVLALAAAAVQPSYIGWWSAASWHGFTTQKPMTVFVAVTRQTPQKLIEDSAVRFVKVTARKFFGSQTYDVYGRDVAISSPAKTLIDCLDRPDLAGGPAELVRIAHSALGEADPHDLLAAATAMKSKAVLQRLRVRGRSCGATSAARRAPGSRGGNPQNLPLAFWPSRAPRRRHRLRRRMGPVRQCAARRPSC